MLPSPGPRPRMAAPSRPRPVESVSRPLEEHPAMALEVFGAIPRAIPTGLRLAEDGRAPLFGPLVMRVDVIDVNQHAVHVVGHGRPSLRRLAAGPVAARALAVGRRPRPPHEAPPGR